MEQQKPYEYQYLDDRVIRAARTLRARYVRFYCIIIVQSLNFSSLNSTYNIYPYLKHLSRKGNLRQTMKRQLVIGHVFSRYH